MHMKKISFFIAVLLIFSSIQTAPAQTKEKSQKKEKKQLVPGEQAPGRIVFGLLQLKSTNFGINITWPVPGVTTQH